MASGSGGGATGATICQVGGEIGLIYRDFLLFLLSLIPDVVPVILRKKKQGAFFPEAVLKSMMLSQASYLALKLDGQR